MIDAIRTQNKTVTLQTVAAQKAATGDKIGDKNLLQNLALLYVQQAVQTKRYLAYIAETQNDLNNLNIGYKNKIDKINQTLKEIDSGTYHKELSVTHTDASGAKAIAVTSEQKTYLDNKGLQGVLAFLGKSEAHKKNLTAADVQSYVNKVKNYFKSQVETWFREGKREGVVSNFKKVFPKSMWLYLSNTSSQKEFQDSFGAVLSKKDINFFDFVKFTQGINGRLNDISTEAQEAQNAGLNLRTLANSALRTSAPKNSAYQKSDYYFNAEDDNKKLAASLTKQKTELETKMTDVNNRIQLIDEKLSRITHFANEYMEEASALQVSSDRALRSLIAGIRFSS